MLKLNDFLNPQKNEKGTALLRSLKMSLKRNIMLPSVQMKKSQANQQYQSKLTKHNFQQKDLVLLFQHMYNKQEMSVSDRNLIRRILLTIFPESLIIAGGRKLIHHTSFMNLQKGESSSGNSRFYLVMKGTIKIQSPFYQKKVEKGMYFGHYQIMSNLPYDSFIFKAQTDTSLIVVSQQGFNQTLLQYFQKQSQAKIKVIPKVLTERLQTIETLLITQEMNPRTYSIGGKICKKGQLINQLVFLDEGILNQNLQLQSYQKKLKAQNTVGLIETILDSKKFLSDSFALEQSKVFYIQLKKFQKIVQKQIIIGLRNDLKSNSLNNQGFLSRRSKTSVTQQNVKKQKQIQSIRKFTKIRKVNLPLNKLRSFLYDMKSTTQGSKTDNSKIKFEASFVFINSFDLQKSGGKQNRLNKSQLLPREARQSQTITQNRRYLDNFDVPSLQQYRLSSL